MSNCAGSAPMWGSLPVQDGDGGGMTLNDLAYLVSTANFVLELHGDEFRRRQEARGDVHVTPGRLALAAKRAFSSWSSRYWDVMAESNFQDGSAEP